MTRASLPNVNKAIAAKGWKAMELVKGEGYFYFVWDQPNHYCTKSIPVFRITHLSHERWLEEAAEFHKELQEKL